MAAGRHHQNCRDSFLCIAASPANQVVALASSLESDFRNRRWIVDQLDAHEVEFSFQRIPSIQMGTSLGVHRVEQLCDLHDHLSSLPNHELFALESRQMLGHSRA